MTYRLLYSPRAQEDLRLIRDWLFDQTDFPTEEWISDCLKRINDLKDFPKLGRLALEDTHFEAEIRQILVGKRRGQYRVLYTIEGNEVRILHIRHSMRQYVHEDPNDDGFKDAS